MQTHLDAVQQRVNQAIEQSAILSPHRRRIAGFDVIEDRPSVTTVRDAYDNSVQAITNNMARIGITPLAFFPARWWDSMMSKSKFVMLEPDGNSLQVDLTKHHKAISEQSRYGGIAMLSIFFLVNIAIVGVWMGFVYARTNQFYLPPRETVFMLILLSILPSLLVTAVLHSIKSVWYSIVTRVYSAWVGRYEMLRSIVENKETRSTHRRQIGIALPSPPPAIMDLLTKLERITTISVAAPLDTIRLGLSPREMLVESLLNKTTSPALPEPIANSWGSPIIFIRVQHAIAVLSHFGDFPISMDVVEQVIEQHIPLAVVV